MTTPHPLLPSQTEINLLDPERELWPSLISALGNWLKLCVWSIFHLFVSVSVVSSFINYDFANCFLVLNLSLYYFSFVLPFCRTLRPLERSFNFVFYTWISIILILTMLNARRCSFRRWSLWQKMPSRASHPSPLCSQISLLFKFKYSYWLDILFFVCISTDKMTQLYCFAK